MASRRRERQEQSVPLGIICQSVPCSETSGLLANHNKGEVAFVY